MKMCLSTVAMNLQEEIAPKDPKRDNMDKKENMTNILERMRMAKTSKEKGRKEGAFVSEKAGNTRWKRGTDLEMKKREMESKRVDWGMERMEREKKTSENKDLGMEEERKVAEKEKVLVEEENCSMEKERYWEEKGLLMEMEWKKKRVEETK